MNYFPTIVHIKSKYFDENGKLRIDNQEVKESMNKPNRPYLDVEGTLLADENNTYFIPFRTHLPKINLKKYPETYLVLPSSKSNFAGLDINKVLILNNNIQFRVSRKYIEKKQYIELKNRQDELFKKVTEYVNDYKHIISTASQLPNKYKYSTLVNFHEELGIINELGKSRQQEKASEEAKKREQYKRYLAQRELNR